MESHKRFELSPSAWKAGMLPLHQCDINWVEHRDLNSNLQGHRLSCCRYTMNHILEQVAGFGPAYLPWQGSVITNYTIPASN